jgi:hypothetical protein
MKRRIEAKLVIVGASSVGEWLLHAGASLLIFLPQYQLPALQLASQAT